MRLLLLQNGGFDVFAVIIPGVLLWQEEKFCTRDSCRLFSKKEKKVHKSPRCWIVCYLRSFLLPVFHCIIADEHCVDAKLDVNALSTNVGTWLHFDTLAPCYEKGFNLVIEWLSVPFFLWLILECHLPLLLLNDIWCVDILGGTSTIQPASCRDNCHSSSPIAPTSNKKKRKKENALSSMLPSRLCCWNMLSS